jgi:hypothetical protein
LVPPHEPSLETSAPVVQVPYLVWHPPPQYALVEPHHPAEEQHWLCQRSQ